MPTRKSIFITGAASGIGRQTALLFASKGWFTGLFDVNASGLALLAGQIGQDNCCWGLLDVTSSVDFTSVLSQFSEQTEGTMNILFNCAGVMFTGEFDKLPLNNLQQTIRTNFEGTVTGIYASLDLLRATPHARIINMSSASAFYGVPEIAVYAASKASIRSLTEALDLEFEKFGISVCDINPSFVSTPMLTGQLRQIGCAKSLGVRITPEEVAATVWRAATRPKVHWVPEWRIQLIYVLTRWSPSLQRFVMKWVCR